MYVLTDLIYYLSMFTYEAVPLLIIIIILYRAIIIMKTLHNIHIWLLIHKNQTEILEFKFMHDLDPIED